MPRPWCARTAAGDHAAFEALMRRHNGRSLSRGPGRSSKDDAEAEDRRGMEA